MSGAVATSSDDQRKALIKRIQATRMTLEPMRDDPIWREFLTRAVGIASLRGMDAEKLRAVLAALDTAGAGKPRRRDARSAAGGYVSRFKNDPPHAKARALWINLGKAGKLTDRSDAALDAFIGRRVGQDLGNLTNQQWDAVIKALSDWLERPAAKGGGK
jgi:phage gp16-like protein